MTLDERGMTEPKGRRTWLWLGVAVAVVLVAVAFLALGPDAKVPRIKPAVTLEPEDVIESPLDSISPDESKILAVGFPWPGESRAQAQRVLDRAEAARRETPWPKLPAPEGPLAKERRERLDNWQPSLYAAAYAEAGTHDPSWDAAVETYIVTVTNWLSSGGREAAALNQAMQEGVALDGLKCTDPLVLYWLGSTKDHSMGPETAEPYLRRALEGFAASRYPKLLSFYAARRLSSVLARQWGDENAEVQVIRRQMFVHFGEAAGDALLRNEIGRDLYSLELVGLLSARVRAGELEPAAKAAAELQDPDPWAAAVIRQAHHLECAWQAQEAAHANPADSQSAQVFQDEMTRAYDLCIGAWETTPPRPELPAQLVEICLHRDGLPAALPWFERAVKAQFDYMGVYDALTSSFSPRNGGNFEDLLRLGHALRDSKRYDTWVPYTGIRCVAESAAAIGRDWREIWRYGNEGRDCLETWKAYQADPTKLPDWQAWDRLSIGYAVAWAVGDYPQAATLFNDVAHGWNEALVETVMPRARAQEIDLETHVGNGDQGDVLRRILISLDKGTATTALTQLNTFEPQSAAQADAVAHLLGRACDKPFDADESKATETLRAMAILGRQEAITEAYGRALRELQASFPEALQEPFVNAVGAEAAAFAATTPAAGSFGRKDIVEAMHRLDVFRVPSPAATLPRATADAADGYAEDYRALARLRWLLQARMQHQTQAYETYVTHVIRAEIAKVKQRGLLLDFASEWLSPGRIDPLLATYVGHLLHETVLLPADHAKDTIDQHLADLGAIADPHALRTRCQELFVEQGSPALALRMAALLTERGQHLDAGVLRYRVRTWLWHLHLATISLEAWSPWHCMATFNRVAGFENEVLTYARKTESYAALSSCHYIAAAASLRLGSVTTAVNHLLRGRSLPDDTQEYDDPEGRFASSQAYVAHLIAKIAASGKATPEQLALLTKAFPRTKGAEDEGKQD